MFLFPDDVPPLLRMSVLGMSVPCRDSLTLSEHNKGASIRTRMHAGSSCFPQVTHGLCIENGKEVPLRADPNVLSVRYISSRL